MLLIFATCYHTHLLLSIGHRLGFQLPSSKNNRTFAFELSHAVPIHRLLNDEAPTHPQNSQASMPGCSADD